MGGQDAGDASDSCVFLLRLFSLLALPLSFPLPLPLSGSAHIFTDGHAETLKLFGYKSALKLVGPLPNVL